MMCNVPDLCAGMCTLSYTLSGGAGGGGISQLTTIYVCRF